MKSQQTSPHPESLGSLPTATLLDVTSIVVSSGFLPPRELFRFARSSKAAAASLVGMDLWKQLCVARLGEDGVEKLQKSGFASSFGQSGDAWERLFRALVTQGQTASHPLGKTRPREQLLAEHEAIPKSYFSRQRELQIVPELQYPTKDYCIIVQIVEKDNVTGTALFASVLPGEELTEQQESAFFEDGKGLEIDIPADDLVPEVKVPLARIPAACRSHRNANVVIYVHLLRKTDGKACCVFDCGSEIGEWTPHCDGLPTIHSMFDGSPICLEKEGRDYIGLFDPPVHVTQSYFGGFWQKFRRGNGVSFHFRAFLDCHYDRAEKTEESDQYEKVEESDQNETDLTTMNLLRIRLVPHLSMEAPLEGRLLQHFFPGATTLQSPVTFLQEFLPKDYTSGAISFAHFLEQLTGWV